MNNSHVNLWYTAEPSSCLRNVYPAICSEINRYRPCSVQSASCARKLNAAPGKPVLSVEFFCFDMTNKHVWLSLLLEIQFIFLLNEGTPPPPVRNDKVGMVAWGAMGTVPETYVQKLPRRVRQVKKLPRRVRNVRKLPCRVRNVVDLVRYRELGSL